MVSVAGKDHNMRYMTRLLVALLWPALIFFCSLAPTESALAANSIVSNTSCTVAPTAMQLVLGQFTANTQVDLATGGLCVVVSGGVSQQATVVSACGTPNTNPVVGEPFPVGVDQNGYLCINGSLTVNTITGFATSANQVTELGYLATLAGTVGSTPVALTTSAIASNNTAVTIISAKVGFKGCYVTWPTTATGISIR
jgi:hypothetical protein